MSVSATEGVSPFTTTVPADPSTSTSNTSSLGDEDTFLQLMVAQMKYQDPMNPTDSSQFLSQTAQFTSLEKMGDIADQMKLLVQSQSAFGAASMIGQTVHWVETDGAEQTGTVGGTTFTASGPLLSIDGTAVPLTQVTSVGGDATLPTTGPSGTNGPPTGYPTDPTDPTDGSAA